MSAGKVRSVSAVKVRRSVSARKTEASKHSKTEFFNTCTVNKMRTSFPRSEYDRSEDTCCEKDTASYRQCFSYRRKELNIVQ